MANDQNNRDFHISEENQKMLASIANTAYTLSGYIPTASKFVFTESQIKDIVLNVARRWLDDVNGCFISFDRNKGEMEVYVTIPGNSKHVTSNDLRSGNSAVRKALRVKSKELDEFMKKFCKKGDDKTFPGQDSGDLGIRVQLDRIMLVELDANGESYGKKFGNDLKRRTKVTLYPIFHKPKDGRKFGPFNYLEVLKEINSRNNNGWTPKPSYNIR